MIWKCLFKNCSRDHGSLGYFKSLLNHRIVTKDPKKDVNASLDLLLTVVKRHFLSAACRILGITKLDSSLHLPPGIHRYSSANQFQFLKTIAMKVVEEFTLIDKALLCEQMPETGDGAYNFAEALWSFSNGIPRLVVRR